MSNPLYLTAKIEKVSPTTLEVTRSFKADRNLVYEAYTTPALVRRWMLGPPGWEMPVCEMDIKEGGKFRWRWKNNEDNSEFGFHGVYTQVNAPQKIAHTEIFDPGTIGGDMGGECLVTVMFKEDGNSTTVTTSIAYKSESDIEKALATGMTDGMEMSYKLLDEVLQN